MMLDFKNATKNIVHRDIIERVETFDDVIIFGAGQSGDWVMNLLRENHIFPKCYCDNYSGKWGTKRQGVDVLSFENAMQEYPAAAICVASMWAEEIIEQIKKYDESMLERTWNLLTTMCWETTNSLYISQEPEFLREHKLQFENLFGVLEDDASKTTLEGLLNYRLTRKKTYLNGIKTNSKTYVDDDVIPRWCMDKIYNGVIIDGGAFDGDTVELFIRSWGSRNPLTIHCWEVEEKNYRIIQEKVGTYKPHRIFVHKEALWSVRDVQVGIEGDTLSGKIDLTSKETASFIKTGCIDDYRLENVGFIKLDIEGAEREALKGAECTIKRCRPILAVCAYHLQDDLLVLSDYIRSLGCGYQLVLRHYMSSSGDTILYAIPRQ